MKVTLNIDTALLDRVMKTTGLKTKTAAIDHALREIDRRALLTEALERGSGLGAEALADLFDPASDPLALRAAEDPAVYNRAK